MNELQPNQPERIDDAEEAIEDVSAERVRARERVVYLVEYSPFPRRRPGIGRRIAYTQDRSERGLGLDLPEPLAPGELLRITLRGIDGEALIEGLARVVWCRELGSGRARAGVALLREAEQQPMRRVRSRSEGPAERLAASAAGLLGEE